MQTPAISNCILLKFWKYRFDLGVNLIHLHRHGGRTWTCCLCVFSMLGSMLSGPSTLIISSFSLSHGPSWLAAEAKLPSLSTHVSSSVCLWAAVWLAVCQRESGMISWERTERSKIAGTFSELNAAQDEQSWEGLRHPSTLNLSVSGRLLAHFRDICSVCVCSVRMHYKIYEKYVGPHIGFHP